MLRSMQHGMVEGIFLASEATGPVRSVASVRAEPGRGLEGDRYFDRRGTFSTWPGTGRDVTLVAAEAISAVELDLGLALPAGATRRNVVVRGVDLDLLIGRDFAIGDVRLRGMRPCEPCDHLVKLLGDPRLLRAFAGRGGLRCDVLAGGVMRAGDPVRAIEGGGVTERPDPVACEVPRRTSRPLA
jgi:MOSC domain-containing protein YiiM